jgi:hypothetical protein
LRHGLCGDDHVAACDHPTQTRPLLQFAHTGKGLVPQRVHGELSGDVADEEPPVHMPRQRGHLLCRFVRVADLQLGTHGHEVHGPLRHASKVGECGVKRKVRDGRRADVQQTYKAKMSGECACGGDAAVPSGKRVKVGYSSGLPIRSKVCSACA